MVVVCRVARSWHEDDLRPPARNAVWMPSLEPFVLDPDVAGVSADHEMGVFGEATKFMWCLCDSIKEEPDACYIMAPEFATVSMLILMMMNPEWTFKRAQVSCPPLPTRHDCVLALLLASCNLACNMTPTPHSGDAQLQSMEVYKSVIPEYLLASQKLDFLCFTEGLYKLAETYVPDASAEERTMWLSKMGNRITIRTGSSCLTEEGRAANARALHSLPEWSARHRNSEDAVFGTSTDVANMYDTQLAEDLAHDFEFVDPLHPDDSWRSCPLSQRVVGLFGAEPGTWKYDVSR